MIVGTIMISVRLCALSAMLGGPLGSAPVPRRAEKSLAGHCGGLVLPCSPGVVRRCGIIWRGCHLAHQTSVGSLRHWGSARPPLCHHLPCRPRCRRPGLLAETRRRGEEKGPAVASGTSRRRVRRAWIGRMMRQACVVSFAWMPYFLVAFRWSSKCARRMRRGWNRRLSYRSTFLTCERLSSTSGSRRSGPSCANGRRRRRQGCPSTTWSLRCSRRTSCRQLVPTPRGRCQMGLAKRLAKQRWLLRVLRFPAPAVAYLGREGNKRTSRRRSVPTPRGKWLMGRSRLQCVLLCPTLAR